MIERRVFNLTNESLDSLKQKFYQDPWFFSVLIFGILSTSIGLAVYAYLGTFSIYISDDYCNSSFFLSGDLLTQMIDRYTRSSNRMSNILFIGISELFGPRNIAVLPAAMLVLFVAGLYKLLFEIQQTMNLGWDRALIFFMAESLAFFSILQAPSLYETLYWRASMATHFAPLVFLPFLGAFILRQIRLTEKNNPTVWMQITCLVGFFIVGWFSEPPAAMMITVFALAIFMIWWLGKGEHRYFAFAILGWSLMGISLALIVMAVAPVMSTSLVKPPPPFPELISRIIRTPFEFIIDTLRTLPVPTIVSIVVPTTLIYCRYSLSGLDVSKKTSTQLGIIMVAVIFISYLLIAASFAPSAYGQSYPAERARFAGRLIMTGSLMLEGAILGILAAGWRKLWKPAYLRVLAIFLFAMLVLYPLRSAWFTYNSLVPEYRQRATAWYQRDAEIRSLKSQGQQDLVVKWLHSFGGLKELDDRPTFRINRCASVYYGVNSIRTVPMGK